MINDILKNEYASILWDAAIMTGWRGKNHPMICIFDLDGTLSNGDHRLHLVPKKDMHLTETWMEFNSACVNDSPIQNTLDVMEAMHKAGMYVIILTGRSDHVINETYNWLEKHGAQYHSLVMRKNWDNRKDTTIKEEFLRFLGLEKILACWDDSTNVIRHFRSLGLTVYDVVEHKDTERNDLKSHGVDEISTK